jgi:hypothetical protein
MLESGNSSSNTKSLTGNKKRWNLFDKLKKKKKKIFHFFLLITVFFYLTFFFKVFLKNFIFFQLKQLLNTFFYLSNLF